MLGKELELGLPIVIRILFLKNLFIKPFLLGIALQIQIQSFFFCAASIIQITLSNALAGPQYG